MESNEQTELTSKRERDSLIESRLTALGLGRLRGVEGLSKKEKKSEKIHEHSQQCGDSRGWWGVCGGGRGHEVINGNGKIQ